MSASSDWAQLRARDPREGERVLRETMVACGGQFRAACARLGASYPHAWQWLRAEQGRWERVVVAARREVAKSVLADAIPPERWGFASRPSLQGRQLRGKAWHEARRRARRARALF